MPFLHSKNISYFYMACLLLRDFFNTFQKEYKFQACFYWSETRDVWLEFCWSCFEVLLTLSAKVFYLTQVCLVATVPEGAVARHWRVEV